MFRCRNEYLRHRHLQSYRQTMFALEGFLRSGYRNEYVRYRDLRSYCRKGHRILDNRMRTTLERANTTNIHRSRNACWNLDYRASQTGQYREFDELMRRLGAEYGYEAIFIENVLNDFLPGVLRKWGYRSYRRHLDW